MKIFIVMILSTVSMIAQSQFRTGDVITTEDKLRFLDSLNKYRIEVGAPPVKYSFQEDSLARLRVSTIFRHIDSIGDQDWKKDVLEAQHYRFFEDIQQYDKSNVHPDTVLSWQGECTARLSKLYKIEDLVDELFHGWKNSPEHWKLMLDPKYEFIVLDWFIDNQRHPRLQKGYFAALVLFSKDVNQKRRGL